MSIDLRVLQSRYLEPSNEARPDQDHAPWGATSDRAGAEATLPNRNNSGAPHFSGFSPT